MGRSVRRIAMALVGASALWQIGAALPAASASTIGETAGQRILVDAPEPSAVSTTGKAPPPGMVVQHLSPSLHLSANYNHVEQLSEAAVADLTRRTHLRNIESVPGFLTGLVDTAHGIYRVTIRDGYLASGRPVVSFGAEPVEAQTSRTLPFGLTAMVLDAQAATRPMLACSYSTVDPATNNLFLYICPRDVEGITGVLLIIAGALMLTGPVGVLVGTVLAIGVVIGRWIMTNNDGSISLIVPPGVWQTLSGWFYYGTGQYVLVNGNPCQVYYENYGWFQGCQLSDTFNWVAVNFDGRLEPVVIGGGNNAYSRAQACNPDCGWYGWTGHGGFLTQRPTLASDVNGELNAIGVGSGGNLREAYQSSRGSSYWYGWYTLGCCFTGHVAMDRNADGRLEAVVRNGNGYIDQFYETSQNGLWNGYGHLMCCFASSPTIESNTDGRLEVFAIDNYKNLFHVWQTAPNGGWSSLSYLGCCLIGNPQASRFADGSLAVFGIGTDRNLYYMRQTSPGGGWTGWTGLGGGGNLMSDPVARLNVDGRLEVFVIDSNNHLRDVWENSPNGSWSWGDLGCCVKGNPDVQMNVNGKLEAFAVGMDNALYHKWQNGPGQGPWGGWAALGGVVTVTP